MFVPPPSEHDEFANQFYRETASVILSEYLESLGGKGKLLQEYQEAKAEGSETKGRKRGRSSVGANNEAPAKRGRKSHPASTSPSPAMKEFRPPTGSWEEDVIAIDACEGSEGNVVVYLTWKGNHKTQHPLSQVYKRCPQRVRISLRKHAAQEANRFRC